MIIKLVQICNESLVCIGSGIFGLVSVLLSGGPKDYVRYVGYTTAGTIALFGILSRRQRRTVDSQHVVVVTGCDSGLG